MVVIFQYYIYEGLLKIASNIVVGCMAKRKEEKRHKSDVSGSPSCSSSIQQLPDEFCVSCQTQERQDATT